MLIKMMQIGLLQVLSRQTSIHLLVSSVIAVISIAVIELMLRWLKKRISEVDNTKMAQMIINIFRVILYAFIIIAELKVWGVPILGLLAGAGFIGIVLGLALQTSLSNFFAGIYILLSGTIKINQKVSINAIGSNIMVTGIIKHIGFSHTELLHEDNQTRLIPNSLFLSSILTIHT